MPYYVNPNILAMYYATASVAHRSDVTCLLTLAVPTWDIRTF